MTRIILVGLGLIAGASSVWATAGAPPIEVPEPASLAVLAAGVGALLIARSRRK